MSPLDRIRWMASVASVRLPASCYRLSAHLAAMAVRDGVCWASRRNLAQAAGMYESRLPMAFRALNKAGLITRGNLVGQPGRQTYEWELRFPEPTTEVVPGTECVPPTEPVTEGVRKAELDPLQNPAHKGGIRKGGIEGGRTSSPKWVKPTMEEVSAYIQEKGYSVDAEAWFAHYESNGWRVGKNPMKSWRGAVTTWAKSERTSSAARGRWVTSSGKVCPYPPEHPMALDWWALNADPQDFAR